MNNKLNNALFFIMLKIFLNIILATWKIMFFIISSSSINKLLVELCRGTEENNESSRPTNKENKITNPQKSKDFQQFIEDGHIWTVTIETMNQVYSFY